MKNANPKSTPATEVLPGHLDAPPFDESYNYRSVVGMQSYLSNTTRPETAFANHQCARFSANPRKPHAAAIKRLVAYLIKTRNEGMIIRKFDKADNKLQCWVDSDYAGLYSKEDPQDPTACRSRTGFIITIGNNPIYWSSRLQKIILPTRKTKAPFAVLKTRRKTRRKSWKLVVVGGCTMGEASGG